MTIPDSYEDFLAEARAEATRDLADRQLRQVLLRRPPTFNKPGELHPDIAAWMERFLDGDPGNLALFGAVGVGKTYQAWKLLESLAHAGWIGRWAYVEPDEFKRATDRPVQEDLLAEWGSVKLLVLDDIGSTRINDWSADYLYGLINQRWQYEVPIVLTSNVLKIQDTIGERAASRLRDGATALTITGIDRRSPRR